MDNNKFFKLKRRKENTGTQIKTEMEFVVDTFIHYSFPTIASYLI